MTTESTASSSSHASEQATPAGATPDSPEHEKQTISPAERWLKIRERAYASAQMRGFMGGNPYEDWKSAEREIDSEYHTDFRGKASLADPAEVAEEVKSVLSDFGVGHMSVNALLRKHKEGMDKLAAFNRTVIDSTSELAQKQTAVAQDALSEAVKTLQSVAQGKMSTDGVAKQAQLSMKAMENAMTHIKALAEAMTGISPRGKKGGSSSS